MSSERCRTTGWQVVAFLSSLSSVGSVFTSAFPRPLGGDGSPLFHFFDHFNRLIPGVFGLKKRKVFPCVHFDAEEPGTLFLSLCFAEI